MSEQRGTRIRVKICGVTRPEDAEMAVAAGATHIGMIRVPGSGRTRTLDEAVVVAEAVRRAGEEAVRSVALVGVYVDADPRTIAGEAEALGLDVVQLHGAEPPEAMEAVREQRLAVWKVVKPATAAGLVESASRYGAADLLLVEGSSERGRGGVGARFDWDVLEQAVRDLAMRARLGVGGGLTPENVAEAVRRFRPALVDVSSGVESEHGVKDAAKVRAFITAARGADGGDAGVRVGVGVGVGV